MPSHTPIHLAGAGFDDPDTPAHNTRYVIMRAIHTTGGVPRPPSWGVCITPDRGFHSFVGFCRVCLVCGWSSVLALEVGAATCCV